MDKFSEDHQGRDLICVWYNFHKKTLIAIGQGLLGQEVLTEEGIGDRLPVL